MSDLRPRDANRVVQFETNQVYEPVVTSEEVASELECSVEKAESLLEQVSHLRKKRVNDTHVWW